MLFKDILMVQGFAVSAVSDLEENDLFTIERRNGITKCFVFVGKIRDVYVARPFRKYKAIEFRGDEKVNVLKNFDN